ncbi:hypothetical protein EDD22DRAFT_847934 [Suillus occidentalis]|nr:hypothetical protein EDD22DRAFT_847934 [Suillus occidentalis]
MLLRRVHPDIPREILSPTLSTSNSPALLACTAISTWLRKEVGRNSEFHLTLLPNPLPADSPTAMILVNLTLQYTIAELKSVNCVHQEDGPLSHHKISHFPHETIGERVQAMNLDEIAVELKNDKEKFQKCIQTQQKRN